MTVERVEGWACGGSRHVHLTETEANACVTRREEALRLPRERARVRALGWIIGDEGTYLIAVNIKTGASKWVEVCDGLSLGRMRQEEFKFLATLL